MLRITALLMLNRIKSAVIRSICYISSFLGSVCWNKNQIVNGVNEIILWLEGDKKEKLFSKKFEF